MTHGDFPCSSLSLSEDLAGDVTGAGAEASGAKMWHTDIFEFERGQSVSFGCEFGGISSSGENWITLASFEILRIKLRSSLLARALQHVWNNLSELEEEAAKSNKGVSCPKSIRSLRC